MLDYLQRFSKWLIGLFKSKKKAVTFKWTIEYLAGDPVKLITAGETYMLLLRDDQKVSLSIQPLDAKGAPARVDGVPTWSTSDPTVGTLTPAADGLSAVYVAGQMGQAQVSVTADADLGAGVTNISGTLDIQVEPGQAVSIGITAGTPEAQ